MLDQDPESLFENKELLFGPAADGIVEAVALGEGHHTDPSAQDSLAKRERRSRD